MKPQRTLLFPRKQRGSVLIVTLIFAAVIAISLASYIRLSTTASKISYRSHYSGVAMNAAESGLEQAMWSIGKQIASVSSAWDGWDTTLGSTARRTFSLGSVSGGGAVSVKVYVNDRNIATTGPFAIARAIVTPVKGAAVEKWIKISLTKRSRFSNGLVAKNGITFSGNNAYVDSYNSKLGDYDATLASGLKNRNAKGSAGSTSVAMDSVSVGNADIYGYASVGTSNYDGLDVGSQGKVTGDFLAAGGTIDYSRVATNFKANFEVEPAPTQSATSVTIAGDTVLPRPANLGTDSKVVASDGTITYYYEANSVSLKNDEVLNITPGYKVVLTVNGSVSVGGNAAITLNAIKDASTGVITEPSLNLYVSGNIDIGGKGASNQVVTTTTVAASTVTTVENILKKVQGNWIVTGTQEVTTTIPATTTTTQSVNRPKNFMIWGTAETSQSIKVSGNGQLSAVVYAPNAVIEAKGGGNDGGLYGAFIGNTVKMTGNEGFHYDESLAELDSGEPLGISKWDEFVSQVDRTALGTMMNF